MAFLSLQLNIAIFMQDITQSISMAVFGSHYDRFRRLIAYSYGMPFWCTHMQQAIMNLVGYTHS